MYKDINKRRKWGRDYYKKNKKRISELDKINRKKPNIRKRIIQAKRNWYRTEKGIQTRRRYMRKYTKSIQYKIKQRVRTNTKYKQGKLKKGFVYHHWEPYNKNNFIILEDKFHRFYHTNPKLFNMKGRI